MRINPFILRLLLQSVKLEFYDSLTKSSKTADSFASLQCHRNVATWLTSRTVRHRLNVWRDIRQGAEAAFIITVAPSLSASTVSTAKDVDWLVYDEEAAPFAPECLYDRTSPSAAVMPASRLLTYSFCRGEHHATAQAVVLITPYSRPTLAGSSYMQYYPRSDPTPSMSLEQKREVYHFVIL